LLGTVLVLGFETSCDETACAVVRDGCHILSNVVRSQSSLHAPFGGVVPELAGRAHTEVITYVLREALQQAGVSPSDLDAIAVTVRPGLIGSLLVGLTAAKACALAWDKPLLPVDHVHAHVIAPFIGVSDPPLPAVGLVVSGGHTTLLSVQTLLEVRFLGGTTDDAAGEAFDKVAQILGLGYPGGPAVSRAAEGGAPQAVAFPRTLLGEDSLDFSFSGLKTAVLYLVKGQQGRPPKRVVPVSDVAASFQEAVVDTLVAKCERALKKTGYRSLAVGGGVAANARLRSKLNDLAQRRGIPLFLAPPELCTDNAAMVAAVGSLAYKTWGVSAACDLDIDADPNSDLAAGGRR